MGNMKANSWESLYPASACLCHLAQETTGSSAERVKVARVWELHSSKEIKAEVNAFAILTDTICLFNFVSDELSNFHFVAILNH